MTSTSTRPYRLAADLRPIGGPAAAALLMQARFLWHNRERLPASDELARVFAALQSSDDEAEAARALLAVERELLTVLSEWNRGGRLGPAPATTTWPHPALAQLEQRYGGLLPPASPCEYVDEQYAWSCWGMHERAPEWLGHGWFWRPRPRDCSEPLSNMASSSLHDYDTVEDGFRRLLQASVLTADYALLRRDFPDQLTGLPEPDIDRWLLDNVAVLSAGQVRRISPGGDHHELLGLDAAPGGVAAYVDVDGPPVCAGVRQRSGGRAATLFVGDYSFDAEGDGGLRAAQMDVKGLGTHELAAHGENVKNTGLLGLADALRELGLQRLVQRLCELSGEQEHWSTVRFYGIVDTGLRYRPGTVNPATGFVGEKCVLLLRQRQSRAFVCYDGYNFSGSLLMTGESDPAPSLFAGTGRRARRTFCAHGVSAEFAPQALLDPDADPVSQRTLDCLAGTWNLQADAPLTHLMDFSDYYILPHARSHLPHWAMSTSALRRCYALERDAFRADLLAAPRLLRRLFATDDPDQAAASMRTIRAQLAAEPTIVEASMGLDASGAIAANKPQYCMCWFMELDDSEFAKWCANGGPAHSLVGKAIIDQIDAWLPDALPTQSPAESLRAWFDEHDE